MDGNGADRLNVLELNCSNRKAFNFPPFSGFGAKGMESGFNGGFVRTCSLSSTRLICGSRFSHIGRGNEGGKIVTSIHAVLLKYNRSTFHRYTVVDV